MGKKEKYEEIAAKILELIGGKDNISHFVHCMTRLKFLLRFPHIFLFYPYLFSSLIYFIYIFQTIII